MYYVDRECSVKKIQLMSGGNWQLSNYIVSVSVSVHLCLSPSLLVARAALRVN